MAEVVCRLDVRLAGLAGLAGSPVLVEWLRLLGVDPSDVAGFRVLDMGLVEVDCYERDAAGNSFLRGGVVAQTVVTVPLAAPVPAGVMAAGRV